MKDCEIGTDIQEVSDFNSTNDTFLDKIFTESEKNYCLSKSKPAQHFAARFAVKEAVIKAFSQFNEKINYKDIEIELNQKKPNLNIQTFLKKRYSVKISMSHSGDYALSFAIIQRRDKNG